MTRGGSRRPSDDVLRCVQRRAGAHSGMFWHVGARHVLIDGVLLLTRARASGVKGSRSTHLTTSERERRTRVKVGRVVIMVAGKSWHWEVQGFSEFNSCIVVFSEVR
jgi:hypothetical protein